MADEKSVKKNHKPSDTANINFICIINQMQIDWSISGLSKNK